MKLFISIVFVLFFILVGKSQEHINYKTNVDTNCQKFIQNFKSVQSVFYSNVSEELDPDDVDDFKTFGITKITSSKSLSCNEKSEIIFSPPFYYWLSGILLIDLPPPAVSLMF